MRIYRVESVEYRGLGIGWLCARAIRSGRFVEIAVREVSLIMRSELITP